MYIYPSIEAEYLHLVVDAYDALEGLIDYVTPEERR